MARVQIWSALVSLVLVSSVQASKILLLSAPTYSHCAEVSNVGQELVNRGHDVSILFSKTYKHKNCHLKGASGTKQIHTILMTPEADVQSADEMTQNISSSLLDGKDFSIITRLGTMSTLVRCVCSNVLSDTKTLRNLRDENFDLVILDGTFMSYCFFVVPYVMNVRYVAVSTVFDDFVSGRPFLPSISPNLQSQYTDSMTFFQRLHNTLSYVGLHLMGRYLMPMDLVSPLAPELSRHDIINMVAKSELFLYNYDTILSYPLPQMPNHVMIGGIATGPAQPLTGEVKKYYQKSSDGVVLVTFGGNSMDFPESKVKALLRVFKRLKLNVLWKYGDSRQNGNVKVMKWVPQNDLLGHPQTKVFVSHCGNNGVFEALYHGVPLVCTPIIGDQFFNGVRVEHWEVGVMAPLMGSTEEQLYNAITEVLSNSKYTENMRKASAMFHSQSKSPRERAGDAIEHVLRFGGDHLRSRALDMSVFTYMGYDIVCFTSVSVIVTVLVCVKCAKRLSKRFCRRAAKKQKTS
ncbi:UDP-glucuronosyltransferase 2C1-like [Liolophura sinensis]|uniref:UDP-glucuronosyltransferase 2C1-like n=1 Tax=Liolophura sinensis TaxID=3198878 RepID=UPI0031583406